VQLVLNGTGHATRKEQEAASMIRWCIIWRNKLALLEGLGA
jgi:hypothetical protein